MKIAIVCLNLSWQSGGPRLVFSMARELEKNGHKVVIYAPEFTGEYFKELWSGLDIRVIQSKYEPVWSGSGKAGNIFNWVKAKFEQERAKLFSSRTIAESMDADFDVVNVHDFAYLAVPFYKKRNPRSRVIWTANDPPYVYLPKDNFFRDILSRVYNWVRNSSSRKYFKFIDGVAVLDSYNKEWCAKRGLNAVIVRAGADTEGFYIPVKSFKEKARNKKVRLFGLGSFNKYRHYEDTIMSVKILRDRGYDAEALIIANDMWDEKEYRGKILRLIKDNKIEKAVDLRLKGVSEQGLIDAYKETDVFIYMNYLPYPRNGFGFSIAVFEAMSAGLPVVLCRTTTSTDVLEDGKSALFVDTGRPDQIADKVEILMNNPDKYESIATAGQKLVKESMTWDDYTRSMLALISKD